MILRLDKIISSQGNYTRSEAARLIRSGSVSVDGKAVTDCSAKFDPAVSFITVDGRAFKYDENVYIMMNKPLGVVSATTSPGERNVLDLLPGEYGKRGLFPAGRLDKDTTGFVLLTDDGQFAHEILSPNRHVEKTYVAHLDRPISPDKIALFRSGVTLDDGYNCLPAELKILSDDALTVEIKLWEGKYHQIRRMVAACSSHVNALHRSQIGSLPLDAALMPGEYRLITPEELKLIKFI